MTSHDPLAQLFVRRVQETEFDRHAARSYSRALLVAFGARPETPFYDNRGSQHEEPLRKFQNRAASLTWKA